MLVESAIGFVNDGGALASKGFDAAFLTARSGQPKALAARDLILFLDGINLLSRNSRRPQNCTGLGIPFGTNILGDDTMDLLWFALIGLAAGWLAGQIMKSSGGIITDMIVGVVGALLGGALFGMLGISAGGLIGALVTATVGAVILLAILRAIRK